MFYEDLEGDIEIFFFISIYIVIVFLGCKVRGEYFFSKNIF